MIFLGKETKQKCAVLGIDAAWTVNQPSGVSLLVQTDSGWSCLGLAPSYEQFIALVGGEAVGWNQLPKGSEPDLEMLVQVAQQIVFPARVKVIAVDMPVSLEKISGRRAADDAISKVFGSKGCSAHSPNEERPGSLADNFRIVCHQLGFQLATKNTSFKGQSSLIEVYPHVALLKLLDLDYRFPYKVEKSSHYWKGETKQKRRSNLIGSLDCILAGLEQKIDGISLKIPKVTYVTSFTSLKRFEDALDALICSWVAIAYLEGRCVSYGDQQAAIWVPTLEGSS